MEDGVSDWGRFPLFYFCICYCLYILFLYILVDSPFVDSHLFVVEGISSHQDAFA